MELPELLRQVQKIACSAGKEILSVYEDSRPLDVTAKADNSPLTEADRRAHNVIVEQLAALPEKYPILSEESDAVSFQQRSSWQVQPAKPGQNQQAPATRNHWYFLLCRRRSRYWECINKLFCST
mgnify:CR=1 FL=1